MLNVEIGKLRDSEVLEVIREFASYYNEGDFEWFEEHKNGNIEYCPHPCIEVFCYYDRDLVEKNAKELAEMLKEYKNEAFVDFEHFGNKNDSRIMIYVEQDTELFKVVTFAKTLSKYGFRKYMELECLALNQEAKERESKKRIAEHEELKNKGGSKVSELEETVRCKMLFDVLETQLEACFDLGYSNNFESLGERISGFQAVFTQYTKEYKIANLVEDYGLDYFTDQNIITSDELAQLKENNLI